MLQIQELSDTLRLYLRVVLQAGTRRIEALTGDGLMKYYAEIENSLTRQSRAKKGRAVKTRE